MRKLLLLASVFSVLTLQAQNRKEYRVSSGTYIVQYFDTNVVKVTFLAPDYKRNENVSDAVIAKPMSQLGKLRIRVEEKALVIHYEQGELIIRDNQDGAFRGFRFPLTKGEMVFGGGERALPLNRRGYRFNLYNNPWYGYGEGADNLNYSVPFITSSKGYALFFDNPSKGFLDIGKTAGNFLDYGAASGEINVYVIFGDYQQILRSYYRLTGTQPLPPRWALGNLMSRFGYTSEAQVKDIFGKMKAESIPVDAVIFDLFWFGDSIKGTLGNLEWINRSKWPDPKKMISDFKKEGVNTILVTEPFFVETSKNYKASLPYLAVDSMGKPYYLTDFYFGHGGLVDIFRKDAQSWFWQFYKRQMNNGVEAWWGDLGEPEKHPSSMYHNFRDYGQKRLFSADEVHNIYGHNWTKMLYNYYGKEYPNKRLFSLNRSGFAGSQRYSIFPWTGDVSRSWTGFRAQLPVLLGMSMSGVPYVHSDAGGFAGGQGDNELYVRWLQFAAFTPVFRPHGTALYGVDPGAYSFPSEPALIDTPYREYAKNALSMHYLLLPYNYTLAYQQASAGKPLMSPLYYNYENDTAAANVQDEYMWGPNLLVAPVLEKGARERTVYLPKGRWLNIFNSQVYEGGKRTSVPVSLSAIPVFMKEGSFVPTVSRIRNVADYTKSGYFLLNYFPSTTKSTFTWYEDDGVSKNAIAGKKYTLIKCTGQDTGGKIVVEVSPSNRLYLPSSLAVSITVAQKPSAVLLNGKTVPLVLSQEEAARQKGAFSLWMPSISALQVYGSFTQINQLKIEIKK